MYLRYNMRVDSRRRATSPSPCQINEAENLQETQSLQICMRVISPFLMWPEPLEKAL